MSGGEPCPRKDLKDIVLRADRGGRVRGASIPTHDMQPDTMSRIEKPVPQLRSTHLNVSVSLDGLAERAPEVRNHRHDDVQLSTAERQRVNDLPRGYAHARTMAGRPCSGSTSGRRSWRPATGS